VKKLLTNIFFEGLISIIHQYFNYNISNPCNILVPWTSPKGPFGTQCGTTILFPCHRDPKSGRASLKTRKGRASSKTREGLVIIKTSKASLNLKRSLWGDKPEGLLPENCPNFFFGPGYFNYDKLRLWESTEGQGKFSLTKLQFPVRRPCGSFSGNILIFS
jgi:hypothetical protein